MLKDLFKACDQKQKDHWKRQRLFGVSYPEDFVSLTLSAIGGIPKPYDTGLKIFDFS